MKWLEWIVRTYVNQKLGRVKKKAKEERSLALRLVSLNNLYTFPAILEFVNQTISYQQDPLCGLVDIQKTFIEILAEKKGDCDDFQLQFMYLCWGQGFDPYYVVLINRKIWLNHVVCVVKHRDLLWQLDIGMTKPVGPFRNLEELKQVYSKILNSPVIAQYAWDQYWRYEGREIT